MIASDEEMILVHKQEYAELKEQAVWLECLEAAGVDNWDGYDIAKEMYDNYGEK